MKTSITLVFIFLLVITTCFTVFGQQKREHALIVYLEGEVNVHRDEAVLGWGDVDIGFELETWDLLETGGDGLAEIELNSPGQEGTILSVLPETAFYFTVDIESGIRKTRLEMMKGSLGVKVARVFDDGEVVVSTQSVVAGVRGTDFTVTAAADGSLLITCTEGWVICTDQRGREFTALPGQAVENLQEGIFRETALAGKDAAEFRKGWIASRLLAFKVQAGPLLKSYYPLYQKLDKEFHDAFSELSRHRSIWRKWARYYRTGTSPAPGEAMRDKITLSPGIIRMRSVFFLHEKVHFRVLEIRMYFLRYQLKDFDLKRRVSALRFLRELAEKEREVRLRMAVTRYYFKLYRYLNRMSTPFGEDEGDELMDSLFSEDPFTF